MDPSTQKALTDKLYDKRKAGAYELENIIRDLVAKNENDTIAKIVHQLCYDYAYSTHQQHARNGGLIGLAAAAIALGGGVSRYLEEIVPPVLACFNDQDARVRYYACESMYNIAKVAKGEILPYFNQVFDALCKLAADSELSVKNGAELLDRLVKDIVAESAATYVSSVQNLDPLADSNKETSPPDVIHTKTDSNGNEIKAFSLREFIPLLQDRMTVLNPYTRMFLVSWITLLDSIPDLELVSYLPAFLGGLFKFLSDSNQDVHTATHNALERFLAEIRKIARVKHGIVESQKGRGRSGYKKKRVDSDSENQTPTDSDADSVHNHTETEGESSDGESDASGSDGETSADGDDDWVPGQDVHVDYSKILEIMVTFLGGFAEQEIQLTALRWIDSFFDICPEDILSFVPRLLTQVLPAMSNDIEQVRVAAGRVNESLLNYILTLPDGNAQSPVGFLSTAAHSQPNLPASKVQRPSMPNNTSERLPERSTTPQQGSTSAQDNRETAVEQQTENLDWEATVNALTLQFLNDHEATRVAALNWLIMLHRKAPAGRKLEINDGTFPALLKTLSDASEAVVTRDLVLLSQMSRNTDDPKFSTFMVNLLNLFATDRKLLENRGNLIIRQLCISLQPERIFRTLAECLDKEEDVEFASIMVQNLNNNLITAPELSDLRKRLRNLDTREGQAFFVALFRSWCHNAVATFSLCLLAQAYEQAYQLLQIFAELDMTVHMLIQIDKLVQLLESPVFTYLRLQLLEPERYPHLYKCLYGLLMFLPQSAAFAALKNRLNSVSAIGYLHIAPRTGAQPAPPNFADRPNRLKSREDQASTIRWGELLEKFRSTQERAKRSSRPSTLLSDDRSTFGGPPPVPDKEDRSRTIDRATGSSIIVAPPIHARPGSGLAGQLGKAATAPALKEQKEKARGLGLGRFTGGGRKAKK